MKFNLTFTQSEITPAKHHAVEHIAQHLELKGFRPGKAPLDLVEKSVDPQKLATETINHLIPTKYSNHVKKNNLKPITQPRIQVVSMEPGKDWEFEIEIAEKPSVALNKYQDEIKAAKAKDSIWTPGKDEKLDSNPETEDKKLSLVFDTLLQTCKVEVPELLIDEEVDRALSRLVSQVEKLGLSIDRYLSSLGKTPESITEDYKKTATTQLQLEFIMDAIITDLKIEVAQSEVEAVLATAKPEQRAALEKNVMEMATLKYSLAKQKAVEALMAL